MKRLLLIIPLLAGCTITKEVTSGRVAIIHHTRATGIEATIPNQTGDTILKLRLGWFSDTTSIIPCSTNGPLYAAPISDTFKLGNAISFTGDNSTITEDVQTGWTGNPPTPRISLQPIK